MVNNFAQIVSPCFLKLNKLYLAVSLEGMYSCCSIGLSFWHLGGVLLSQIWVSLHCILQYLLSCFFIRADLINYSFP